MREIWTWAFQIILAILLFGLNKIPYLSIPRVAEAADQHEMFGPAEISVMLPEIDYLTCQFRTNVRYFL